MFCSFQKEEAEEQSEQHPQKANNDRLKKNSQSKYPKDKHLKQRKAEEENYKNETILNS